MDTAQPTTGLLGIGATPEKTYVPGIGMLGPDLGGYVKGDIERRTQQREDNTDLRSTNYLNIMQAKENREQTDWQREKSIQAGMVQAANDGGYEGVISYLQNADPERAIDFTKKKLDLDQSIMKTDIMKAATPATIADIQLEAYGSLGKMGAALLGAEPKDRENLYKTMLPMIKAVNPDASDSLDDKAVSMFLLARAQATPENILFQNRAKLETTKSELGRALEDLNTAQLKYGTNSKEVQLLRQQINDISASNTKAQAQIANTIARNTRQGEDALRGQWLAQTKDFNTVQNSYNSVIASYNNQGKSGSGGPDDMALIYNYMKMLDPTSVIMPGEYANAENTAGISDTVRQRYNKALSGQKLSESQRSAFVNSAKALYDTKLTGYRQLKNEFTGISVNRGYDVKNILVERQYENKVANKNTSTSQQPTQEQIEYTAKKYNMTPDQVRAKLGGK